jgi:hypothetical protein
MNKIEMFPQKGIKINDTIEINLDSKADTVKKIIGKPDSKDKSKWFYDIFEARLDFDNKNKLEYIEFIGGPFCNTIELSIYGINPFGVPGKKLIEILLENGNGNIVSDSDTAYIYTFPDISVGIWRETPEIIKETIEELKNKRASKMEIRKIEADLIKSKYFWTIGIGVKDYYNKK